MTTRTTGLTRRQAGVVTGVGLLLMTVAYVLADSLVFKALIVSGDPVATSEAIAADGPRFRVGVCGYVVVIICDVVVAWALYVLLEPVNKSLSLLSAWFRLTYSIIFAVALLNYFDVLNVVSGAEASTGFPASDLHAHVMLSLAAFTSGWGLGLVFFGLHIVILGHLVFRSGYLPKFIGVLLMAAGVGYLMKHFGEILWPTTDLTMLTVAGWSELLLAVWLLWKERAQNTAS